MQAIFWGTRGSLPAAAKACQIREKIFRAILASRSRDISTDDKAAAFIDRELPFAIRGGYGGNTSCVEIKGGKDFVLCDAGTGIRDFGQAFMKSEKGRTPAVFHIFLSHPHWDHIQGFPFFVPAFIPGHVIHIYGGHTTIKDAFMKQQEPPCFPVPFQALGADIRFHTLDPAETHEIAGMTVRMLRQNHPGGSFGYSFVRDGRKIVYSTDMEHGEDAEKSDYPFIDFFHSTDLLIFDAQYSLAEAIGQKETWGHSSNLLGVELAVRSGVKRLCLFHSEPTMDDDALDRFLAETRGYLQIHASGYPLAIDLAYDGMEIEL